MTSETGKWVIRNTHVHYFLIISAKEVMFSPGFVCAFVSLFVNKIAQKLMDGL